MEKIVSLISTGLVFLLGALPGTAQAAYKHLQPWYRPRITDHTPLILAHQGGGGEYPTNSMLAFTKTYEAGSDALDSDMHATKDGVLVLFHDETLEGQTNGSGPIRDKTYAELLQLDFAYNWSPDGGKTFPYRGQGIKVVTVRELMRAFPQVRLGIEIKQTTTQAAQDFCTLIYRNHAKNRVLVSSAIQENMDAFRAACPKVATSATPNEVLQFYTLPISLDQKLPYSSLQIPEERNGLTLLTHESVARAHQFGLKVYAWTIDTTDQAQRLTDMGVDGLNTNYPRRLIDWSATR